MFPNLIADFLDLPLQALWPNGARDSLRDSGEGEARYTIVLINQHYLATVPRPDADEPGPQGPDTDEPGPSESGTDESGAPRQPLGADGQRERRRQVHYNYDFPRLRSPPTPG